MTGGGRVQRIVLSGCGALILALIAAPQVGGSPVFGIKTPGYAGKILGAPGSEVLLKRKRRFDPEMVRFQALKVPEICTDGETPVAMRKTTFAGFDMKYLSARRVRVRFRRTDMDTGDKGKFIVRARFSRDYVRIKGTLFHVSDRNIPPPVTDPRYYDCYTDGKLKWRAERVGRAG